MDRPCRALLLLAATTLAGINTHKQVHAVADTAAFSTPFSTDQLEVVEDINGNNNLGVEDNSPSGAYEEIEEMGNAMESAVKTEPYDNEAVLRVAGDATVTLAAKVLTAASEARMQAGMDAPAVNTVISPLGLHQSLSLAQLGATPDSPSHEELAIVTGVSVPESDEQKGIGALHSALMTEGSPLLLANSVWSRPEVLPTYTEAALSALEAEARQMPEDATEINSWVSSKTNGLITKLLDDDTVKDPLLLSVLLNAVYFKAAWKVQFDPKLTTTGNFTTRGGVVVPDVPYMHMKVGEAKVIVENIPNLGKITAISLPYANDGYRAILLLPDDGLDVHEMVKYVFSPMEGGNFAQPGSPEAKCEPDSTRWCHISAKTAYREWGSTVGLFLPKFKLESGVMDVTAPLKASGMLREATMPNRGGFLRMTDDTAAHIDRTLQKATMEFTEEGTEASAATATLVSTRSLARPRIFRLKFDHPFVVVIEHEPTRSVAFAAIVEDPLQSS